MLATQTNTASAADADEARLLAGQIMSGWRTQALHVAARLELADRLADGPMETATLARMTGSDAGGLMRLLRKRSVGAGPCGQTSTPARHCAGSGKRPSGRECAH